MKTFAAILALTVVPVTAAGQAPAGKLAAPARYFKQVAAAYAHDLRVQFTDIRHHPFAWGVPFALNVAVNFADAGSTCNVFAHGGHEGNPAARVFTGRSCTREVTLTSVLTFAVQLPAEHRLSDAWTASCYRSAANPDSAWHKVDARTYDPESCRWNVPVAGLAPQVYHVAVVVGNVREAR